MGCWAAWAGPGRVGQGCSRAERAVPAAGGMGGKCLRPLGLLRESWGLGETTSDLRQTGIRSSVVVVVAVAVVVVEDAAGGSVTFGLRLGSRFQWPRNSLCYLDLCK